jgi:uncharacterized protein (TIGR04255 family)
MPFKLPVVQLPHLPASPVRLVIAQVQYRPVLAIEDPTEVAAFQKLLADDYDLAAKQIAPVLRVLVGQQELAESELPTETVWRFEGRDRPWVISLSSSSFGLEASSYDTFDSFAGEFNRILDALVETFEPRRSTRLGLRYINEVQDARVTGSRLAELFRRELLGPIGEDLGYDLTTSLAELRFAQPDGLFVIRHGLVQPETYLLDFDYFVEEEADFSTAGVKQRVSGYHTQIESLFVWTLNPKYLDELKEADEPVPG